MPSRRSAQHVSDTAARWRTVSTFPSEWEWRESTGRDYGIDMEIEPFKGGETMGRLLLLQIKGRKQTMPSAQNELSITVETSALRYAERFVSPFILVVCPLLENPPATRFVWIQEYLRVRLPLYAPGWRSRRWVTIRLPADNQMPGADRRLQYAANYPKRLESWGHLARLQNEIRRKARESRNLITAGGSPSIADRRALRRVLLDAARLPGLFIDQQNDLAQMSRQEAIEPGLRAARLLVIGPPYSNAAIAALGWNYVQPAGYVTSGNPEQDLTHRIELAGEQLSSYLSLATDIQMKQTRWVQFGVHEW